MPLFVSTGSKLWKFFHATLTLSVVASKQLPEWQMESPKQRKESTTSNLSFPIITSGLSWEIVMLLIQALCLKDGSAFGLFLIFEHLLWTQWLQLWQKIELIPTPLQQILHGHFAGSDFTDELCYKNCIQALFYWHWSRALLPQYYLSRSWTSFSSPLKSPINARLSAYSNYQGQPTLNSLDRASITGLVFSFKIYFSFSFCSDFNLEVTVAIGTWW